MYTQLVALASDGFQFVPRERADDFEEPNFRDRIGRAFRFALLHKVGRFGEARFAAQHTTRRPGQYGVPGGNRFVGFMHRSIAKQRVVGVACGRVDGEHHQPGGVAVDAVDGHQVIQTELVFQAHKHGLLQVFAGRHDRQEVRFVHHQQVRILVQHDFPKRDRCFLRYVAKVIEAKAGLVG